MCRKIELEKLVVKAEKFNAYLPYADSEQKLCAKDGKLVLPDFMRSAVIKIEKR